MAVQYIKEKTKQKYYLMAFGAVIVITLIVLWFGFLKDSFTFLTPSSAVNLSSYSYVRQEIRINFDFLESQTLKDMEVFNQIPAYDGQVGREEPFLKPSGGEIYNPPALEEPVEEPVEEPAEEPIEGPIEEPMEIPI